MYVGQKPLWWLMRSRAIAPMTLGNMRTNGVRSLLIYCPACHRSVPLNVDSFGESVPIPAFGLRMVCTECGMIGADARPNWREQRAPGAWDRGTRS